MGSLTRSRIDPRTRRRGLGRALIETARRFLRDQGITRMRVEHWAFNHGAAAFFAGEGLRAACASIATVRWIARNRAGTVMLASCAGRSASSRIDRAIRHIVSPADSVRLGARRQA